MKGITFQGVERVEVRDLPDPRILEGRDVLLEVSHAGLCGSDLHAYLGREKGLDPGTVMGHEFVGRVIEAGPGVRGLSPGDQVCGPFTTCCGSCFYCRQALPARCESGLLFGWRESGEGLHGAQAEQLRVPLADATLVKLPAGLDPLAGLLLGDNLATGWYSAEMARCGPGRCAVVLGCGAVGLLAVLSALALGAETVFAVDALPARLEAARRLGGIPLDYTRSDPVREVHAATSGRGADSVMEMVGSPEATRTAVNLCRPGGVLHAAGVHTEAAFAFAPGEAYDKNLTYSAGRCPARAYMDKLAPLAVDRSADLVTLFTHRMSLDDGPRAYEIFAGRKEDCIKIAFELRDGRLPASRDARS